MNVKEWLGENNTLGHDIWEKKYRYNNESFDEWLDRVSAGNKNIRKLIEEKKFLYAGRILSNRGLYKEGQKITYSNCYVIAPPEDSIESIFDCAKRLARTFSYGGGCGIDISKLSPKGAVVNNAAKQTSGSVSFMDLYSLTTELIGQNGRRGALMISIACDHPDIEDFITIKSDLDKVTKANISIRVTDDFMDAVTHNKDFKLSFTREETGEVIEKTVKAKEIFGKFCEMNWDYAEPAFLFWDRIQSYNLLQYVDEFEYAGVNPCAEEPLPSGGSCLLGSLNLSEFVTPSGIFDFMSFRLAVGTAVIGLNEVLDEGLPLHPLQEQRDTVRDWRQIGLGIMGLADMLIKMGITYGSEESIEVCDNIGKTLATEAILTSMDLAKEHGAFPKFTTDVYKSHFFKRHCNIEPEQGIRNSQLLTIAPTGTLSTMLGISGGIEPIFANSYTRKTESLHGEDVSYKVYTPIVAKYMNEYNITEEEDLPSFFVTSATIPHRNRIDMQAVWQSHIDASISSTVNLPKEATVEDVEDLYIYAWKQGLKGITVFRDGCKRMGILTTDDEDVEDKVALHRTQPSDLPRGYVLDASDEGIGLSTVIHSGCGKIYLYVKFDPNDGQPYEIFVNKGSQGTCRCNVEGLARMTSYALRSGAYIEGVVDQLKSVDACASYTAKRAKGGQVSQGSCCPAAIGFALERLNKQYQEMFVTEDNSDESDESEECCHSPEGLQCEHIEQTTSYYCPECGEELRHEGGCILCVNCGWSKCS